MTWNEGGFDGLAFELERGRFGEYTAEKLMKRFGPLKPAGIRKLKSFPTLFVEENLNGNARVGYLTEIRERNQHVLVEFDAFGTSVFGSKGSSSSSTLRGTNPGVVCATSMYSKWKRATLLPSFRKA